jgi:hypothetical protein
MPVGCIGGTRRGAPVGQRRLARHFFALGEHATAALHRGFLRLARDCPSASGAGHESKALTKKTERNNSRIRAMGISSSTHRTVYERSLHRPSVEKVSSPADPNARKVSETIPPSTGINRNSTGISGGSTCLLCAWLRVRRATDRHEGTPGGGMPITHWPAVRSHVHTVERGSSEVPRRFFVLFRSFGFARAK